MRKNYFVKGLLFVSLFLLVFASCKKDNKQNVVVPPPDATPKKIGLFAQDTDIYKALFMPVSTIGSQDLTEVNDGLFFDTGSGGLVIDATGILPKAMISDNGFTFTGDSTIVNGITITNQKSTIEYGADDSTASKVYGYLAYAPLTIGDNGEISLKRIPFFLYYKATDAQNNKYSPHEFDIFGVSPEYDLSFDNGAVIQSPLFYYDPGTGLTKGFKLAALAGSFTNLGYLASNLVTLGLTSDDLSSASGFSMNELTFHAGDGYAPIIKTSVTYGGKKVSTYSVFDTGTTPYSYLQDPTFSGKGLTLLPLGTAISVTTNGGFSYSYTITKTDNLTYVENPNTTGGQVTLFGLEFFLNNEYMLNYANHQLGLKND